MHYRELKIYLLSHVLDFIVGMWGLHMLATRIGIIFDEDSLLQKALYLLLDLHESINSEHLMDVISGNAGAISPLLVMYNIFHEKKIFELAVTLGNELLSCSTKEKVGLSWNSKVNDVESTQHNLTGFSHGAAGIGYGLLELFTKTDRKEYREARRTSFCL